MAQSKFTAVRNYLSPVTASLDLIGNKPLFNNRDWKNSIREGTLDMYTSALMQSDGIDLEKFYRDYNIPFGNPENTLPALYNELSADRTTLIKNGERLGLKRKTKSLEEQNKERELKAKGIQIPIDPYDVEMTDYEYNKQQIAAGNSQYAARMLEKHMNEVRINQQGLQTWFSDLGAFVGNLAGGFMEGTENIAGGIYTIFASMDKNNGKLNEDYWTRLLYNFNDFKKTNDDIFSPISEAFAEWEYRYTHLIDENGNYTGQGIILKSVAQSFGQMIPSAILGKGIGVLAGLKAGVNTVNTISRVVSQSTFYGSNIFMANAGELYDNFSSKGISVPTTQIYLNSALKAGLQWGVEFGLGKLLGATGLDTLTKGSTGKGFGDKLANYVKSPTLKGLTKYGIDILQEGVEESLQEFTDFATDGFSYFINNNFQNVKWDWEVIGNAFVMGCISSMLGGAANIIGTKRVNTGKIKTNKNGELIRDLNGDLVYDKLGKFASYSFGLDMQSFAEAYESVISAGKKLQTIDQTSKKYDKAIAQYKACYTQAVVAQQMLADFFGEIGKEKFEQANSVLKVISEAIDAGKFDINTVEENQKAINLDISELAKSVTISQIKQAVKKVNATEIDSKGTADVIETGDTKLDDEIRKIVEETDSRNWVVTKDGERAVKVGDLVIIPKNLLLNGGDIVTTTSIAEQEMAERLSQEIIKRTSYKSGTIEVLKDLFIQWSGREITTEDEAIITLIYDERFFKAVMATNEKLSCDFVLSLNSIIKESLNKNKKLFDTIFRNRVNECMSRWTDAALDFYSNNLTMETSNFTRGLDYKSAKEFNQKLSQRLQLFNMGKDIISDPLKVTQAVWDFIERRISNLNVEEEIKSRLRRQIRDTNSQVRESAITEISSHYQYAFTTLYNGSYYMPMDSMSNMVFNNWLQTIGYNIGNLFDVNYLSESNLIELGDNPADEEIYNLRKKQFEDFTENGYSFELDVKGKIIVKSDIGPDGYSKFQSQLYEEAGKDIVELSQKIPVNIRQTVTWLKNLMDKDYVDLLGNTISINDLIVNYTYLNDAVKDSIIEEYGTLNAITVFRYIQENLTEETNGKYTVIVKDDGTFVIAEMVNIMSIFDKDVTIPAKGEFLLINYLKPQYRHSLLGTATVKFGAENNKYVAYETRTVDGKRTAVFANRIEIASYKSESNRKVALSHEITHVIQKAWGLNNGIRFNVLRDFGLETQKSIIKDIKSMHPELFENSNSYETDVNIVNKYLYYSTGESVAYGLGYMASFYPVIVRERNGVSELVLQNGHKYIVPKKIDSLYGKRNVFSVLSKILIKFYSKNFVKLQNDPVILDKMNKALRSINYEILYNDKRTKENYMELFYQSYKPNGDRETFENASIFCIIIKDRVYTIRSLDSLENFINSVYGDIPINDYKINIRLGTFKPKDIKSYTYRNDEFGEIEIDRGYIKDVKDINIDLTGIAETISEQSMWMESFSSVTNRIGYTTNDYNDIDAEFAKLVLDLQEHFSKSSSDHIERLNTLLNKYYRSHFGDIIEQWHSFQVGEYLFDSEWRRNALSRIHSFSLIYKQNLTDLKNYLGYSELSFDEFLETELPILRIQNSDQLQDSPFVSCSIVKDIDDMSQLLHAVTGTEDTGESGFPKLQGQGNFFFHKVKAKDILFFLPNNLTEIWVRPQSLEGGFTIHATSKHPYSRGYSFAVFEKDDDMLIKKPIELQPYETSYQEMAAVIPKPEYGVFNGPLYENGSLVVEDARIFNACDVGNLDDIPALKKILKTLNIDLKNTVINDVIRGIFFGDNKDKLDKFVELLMKSENGYTSLYMDGRFLLWNGKVGNYSTYTSEVKQSTSDKKSTKEDIAKAIDEIKKEASTETTQKIETDETPKKKTKKKYPFDPKTQYKQRTASKPKKSIVRSITDPDELEEYTVHEHPTHKYVYRELVEVQIYINAAGEEAVHRIYEYIYDKPDKTISRRWVTNEELKTDLKYFKKPGKQLSMNASLRRFIINATNKKIAPVLREKISGSEKGTLTYDDLIDYVIDTDWKEIDHDTFILIRDVLSDDDSIKDARQLQELTLNGAPNAMALYLTIMEKGDDAMKEILKLNLDVDKINNLYNLLSNNTKYSDKLIKLRKAYGRSVGLRHYSEIEDTEGKYDVLNIDEKYLKYLILRRFTGTISDLSAFGIISRDMARYSFKSRFSSVKTVSTSKSVGKGKYGQSIGELENLLSDKEVLDEYSEIIQNWLTDWTIDKKISTILDIDGLAFGPKLIYAILSKKILSGNLKISESFMSFLSQKEFDEYAKNFISIKDENSRLDLYDNFIKNLTDDKINKLFVLVQTISASGTSEYHSENYQKILDDIKGDELDSSTVIKTFETLAPKKNQKKQEIDRLVLTIQKYVSKTKEVNLFIKEHSDMFEKVNGKIQLKKDIIYDTINGESVLKSIDDLIKVHEIIKNISYDSRHGVYVSKSILSDHKKAKLAIENDVRNLISQLKKFSKKSSDFVSVSYIGKSISFDVKSPTDIPSKLKEILSKGLGKSADSRVQEINTHREIISDEGKIKKLWEQQHLQNIMKDFIKENTDVLMTMNQDEAKEIIEFLLKYTATVSESERAFVAAQEILLAYFLNSHRLGKYDFSDELVKLMEDKLEEMARFFGAGLSNWKTALKELRTTEIMAENMLLSLGIRLDEEDKKNLDDMIKYQTITDKSGLTDEKRKELHKDYERAERRFKEGIISKYKGEKRHILEKLLQFERAMMLSWPGTWIRNRVSNIIVKYGNIASEWTGEKITKLLTKFFPARGKDSNHFTFQYKLNKKPSEIVSTYIKDKFVDTGLFEKIISGVSKYNVDSLSHEKSTTNIVEMIARSISQDVMRANVFTSDNAFSKGTNEVINFIYKMISDDPYIRSKAEYYFGRVLEEDYEHYVSEIDRKHREKYHKVIEEFQKNHNKLSNMTYEEFSKREPKKKISLEEYLKQDDNNLYGINNNVVLAFVKAVDLASYDYMRSPNAITFIEKTMRQNMNPTAYFVYKQAFPFLASSWNWFVEGLRWTPAGLAKSIVDLCKLENTINKMEKAHVERKSILHSDFTKYIKIRNLGKGAIGSTLFVIGMILSHVGFAGLDEEDDEYKLIIGDVKININDVLASQGLMLGISLMDGIKNKGGNAIEILDATFNQMFRDSLFEDLISSFRYSEGVGDFTVDLALDIPSMFWPNFLKGISGIVHHRGIKYSESFTGKLQRLALSTLPLPAEFVGANTYVDIYTGEAESFLSGTLFSTIFNKLLPIDIKYPTVGNVELNAISLGVNKSMLKGIYTIDDKKISLNMSERALLNNFYGKLNQKELQNFMNNKSKHRIKLSNGSYKELNYSQMDDKQKKTVIETIMSNNGNLSKIYILTQSGKYKYYASDAEYSKLKKLGITKNVYRKTKKLNGFVPN